jgi:hypothetical protein
MCFVFGCAGAVVSLVDYKGLFRGRSVEIEADRKLGLNNSMAVAVTIRWAGLFLARDHLIQFPLISAQPRGLPSTFCR